MRRRLACVLLGLGLAAAAGADDLSIHVDLSPRVIGIDELATLTIEIHGGGFRGLDARPRFELDNLAVAAGPYHSESLRFVNGHSSRSESFEWQLRPHAVGSAGVHDVVLEVRGKPYDLPERRIRIQQAPTGTTGGGPGSSASPGWGPDPLFPFPDPFDSARRTARQGPRARPKVFLEAALEPTDPFVGQQAIYTLYLYTQGDISAVDPKALPQFQGLWVRDVALPDDLKPDMVEVGNERYGRVPLIRKAVFPLRSGRLELSPARVELLMRVPETGMFGALLSRTIELQRTSNAVELDARPLPPSPPDFTGAVGHLGLDSSIDPDQVRVGEATTLTVSLTGDAHVAGLPDPRLPELPGIQIYPPQQESNEEVVSGRIRTHRTWRFVLVPTRTGRWQVPALSMPYFDPADGRYATARAEGLDLTVEPAAEVAAAGDGEGPPHSIRSAAVPDTRRPAWRAWLPWLAIVPWGLLAVIQLTRRRNGARRGAPARRRLLAELARLSPDDPPRHVAATLESSWRSFLAERWHLPPGAPSPEWGRLLVERGAPAEAAAEASRLADDLHYLRYAPQLSSTSCLVGELASRSKRLVKALR